MSSRRSRVRVATDVARVEPLAAAVDTVVTVPGSKSITNRALLCAALASGTSRLTGVLFADDTRAMLGAAAALGAEVVIDEGGATADVVGVGRRGPTPGATIDARSSGTTARFVLPVAALAAGRSVVDGSEQLRARPMGPLADALAALGAGVEGLGAPGALPLAVTGPLRGGDVGLPGHLSSQFLSGLLLAGPGMAEGLTAHLTSEPVSMPYLEMTAAVMQAFGAGVAVDRGGAQVPVGRYEAREYSIEPDASAASYFLAAAAITGGRVAVGGLGGPSLQGDVRFAEVLAQMGASVERAGGRLTVTGPSGGARLHGVDVDMADISDTAQTLAAVAVFAEGPTTVRGIGFIRAKETDRIGDLVRELQRAGVDAREEPDGFTVVPGAAGVVRAARFETYGDHRMAMSLALIGLRVPGVEITDPGCVAKTFPDFFSALEQLRKN